MAKVKTAYVCSGCGADAPSWAGQCSACKEWNTLEEVRLGPATKAKASAPGRPKSGNWAGTSAAGVTDLGKAQSGPSAPRMSTHINEFDRALGGGLVPGSVVLLGGDPGIGKSTLLLQTLAELSNRGTPVLYVTGEESLPQVASRAERLGLQVNGFLALAETDLSTILEAMASNQPKVVVIDSIQTTQSDALESAPGTVSQVRECAVHLTRYAKESGCAVFLVGHVTKDGNVAGPRTLEHLVDTVLFFEGDPQSPYRLIRAMKNRFGAVNELGAFEMTGEGLISVDNPSAMFLAADRRSSPGSCVFVLQDGPRPLLIEIQALMDSTTANNPRRLAVGVDGNRLAMLLAILHKHGSLDVGSYDVFANAVGGVKANEPASDLPLILALVSSLRGKSLPADMACFGEAGLTGEIRPVQNAADRIREAAKLGFKRMIVPKRNLKGVSPTPGMQVVGVSTMGEALSQLREWES